MAQRQVTVVINGEEYVSKAAKEAEAGLDGFAGAMQQFKAKLIPVIDVTKLVEWGVRALSAAFTAAKQFVLDSIGAYDAYVGAQTKLSAQSRLTGMSMREMGTLVDMAKEKFGLGTVAAVDITAAVAKFASQAGASSKAAELMATALELGAASGQTAAQVAEGLSSALAGNDEWLNRLGLSNPSQIWKEYADANGLAVATMSETDKKLAVMTAIMDAGNKVAGVYAERMASGAGATEAMNNRLEAAKVAFGAAIQPVRLLAIQGLTSLLNVIGPLMTALGYLASAIVNMLIAPVALARSGFGELMETIGRLTGNKALEQWGDKQSKVFVRFTEDVAKWLGLAKPATDATTAMGKAHELAAVKITASADATKKAGDTAQVAADKYFTAASSKLGAPLVTILDTTTAAMGRLQQASSASLDPAVAAEFQRNLGPLQERAAWISASFANIGRDSGTSRAHIAVTAQDIVGVARGALDAAQAFGVIDRTAASALGSAISMGDSIAKMATSGFTFAGVTGVLGGVANIVSTMMQGDAARRELLRSNNAALARLSRDIGGLKLNVTGEDIDKANTALRGMSFSGKNIIAENNQLRDALASVGLTRADLERIANEFGINLRDRDGNFRLEAVNQVIQALGTVRPGRLGANFQDQLSFFRESQRIDGATGVGAIGGLIDFLRGAGGVTALNGIDTSDPAAMRAGLRGLFTQLANGEGVQGLGRLTGSQFMEIITQIIGDIDNLGTGSGAGVPAPTPPVGGAGIAPSTGASVSSTVQSAVETLLTTANTYQTRIADATEESARRLQSIDQKMDLLIKVSSGTSTGTDAMLGADLAIERRFAGAPTT